MVWILWWIILMSKQTRDIWEGNVTTRREREWRLGWSTLRASPPILKNGWLELILWEAAFKSAPPILQNGWFVGRTGLEVEVGLHYTCPSCVKLSRHQTNGYNYDSWETDKRPRAAFSLPFLFNNLLPGRSVFNFTPLYVWCRNCNCDNVVTFWTILHALLVHKTGGGGGGGVDLQAGMNTQGQVWILLIFILLVLRNPHREAIKAVRNLNNTKPALIRVARHSSRVVAPSMLPGKVSPVQ